MVTLIKTAIQRVGGLEKSTIRLAQAFSKKGIRPTLLTTHCSLDLPFCDVVELPVKNKERVFNEACHAWLKKHPQKVVFGFDRAGPQTHYRAGNGVHGRYLELRRSIDPFWNYQLFRLRPLHRYYLKWEQQIFESSTLQCLFTNSHMVKKEILERYAIAPGKIEVIHNGVDWAYYASPFEKSLFFHEERPYHFLFAGNGYGRKGLVHLLNALARVQSPYVLTVVGHDKQIRSYQKLAHRLGISSKVEFLGQRPSLTPFYQKADSLVIPSLYDPFANTTVEALAMGLYILSSAYNGGKEVLTKECGSIIPDLQNPDSFAHLLEKTLQRPKTRKQAERIRKYALSLDDSPLLDRMVDLTLSAL